jgi:putative ABC transport system permease protein
LGNGTLIREEIHEMNGIHFLQTLRQDLGHGLRMLARNPGAMVAVILTLALGIGANTAIFSVINAVLLRPLPYREPHRLMFLRESKLPQWSDGQVSPGNFLDWQRQNTVFERMAAYISTSFTMTGQEEPEVLRGGNVHAGLFQILGVQPILGRAFQTEEDEPGHDAVVILSHSLWQRRFGGSPAVLNTTLTVNGQVHTIIGVMPPGFSYPRPDLALWTPLALSAQERLNHAGNFLNAIGRLKPGVSVAQAQSEMSAIALRLARQYPDSNTGRSVRVWPLLDYMVRDIKPALIALMTVVFLVLLIACANTANLLLARATARSREIAVRAALGAGRWRVVRQMLTESLVLTAFGAILGVLLAWGGLRVLLGVVPPDIPRLQEAAIDGSVLAFTLGATIFTCLVFGLFPALQASRTNLGDALKEANRGSSGGKSIRRTRAALVVVEVALALILLVGANLMLTSFLKLKAVAPGFDPQNTLTARLELPQAKYGPHPQRVTFTHELIQDLQGLPGVRYAAAAYPMPFVDGMIQGFLIEGVPQGRPSDWPSTNYQVVTPDYFKAMGIPLVRGRMFTDQDGPEAPGVVIISQRLARGYFPNESPIGKRIHLTSIASITFREIVGVVGDSKGSLDEESPLWVYEPYEQQPSRFLDIVLKTEGDPMAMAGTLRTQVAAVDKGQAVTAVSTLEQLMSASIAGDRFAMALLSIFSGLALVLASGGIYGVVSNLVSQRRREFGIRMALGARGRQVVWEITRQSLVLTAIGLGIGLLGTLVAGHILSIQLFGIKPADPLALAQSALALSVVALVASVIPASRAARVDPVVTLREE